ncbi:MAG TPA: DUF881 domain-containing protein [Frankiaceae bacterium]|nr:DUF881 domain-containing protein [Frankiaceae bacterium]
MSTDEAHYPRPSAVRHPQLLDMIVADALDPAYADAATRRRSRLPRARSATAVLLLVGGLAVGLTVGRERTEAPAAAQARTALLGDARQRTATVEGLSTEIEQLRRDTSRLQASVLASAQEGTAVAQQRADLSAAAGETAVTGPGVSVSVDDAPAAATGRGSAEQRPDGTVVTGRVADRDLQEVVNALWAAGAEAISVGGVRLSPTTAIRTAGETILADYRPLSAPYVLLAIGDPGALEPAFRSAGAAILTRLGQQHSPVRITRRTDLHLPAASGTETRVAKPLAGSGTTGPGTPSAGPSTRTPGAHS